MSESKYVLYVKFNEDFPEELKSHYLDYHCNGEDSGVDLVVPVSTVCAETFSNTLDHKISCQMVKVKNGVAKNVGYWLLPRSSISKTTLRMANSIGLIDSGYRGNIMAKVDNRGMIPYQVTAGTRMFQLATGNLTPISEVHVVDSLDDSLRMEGGFGSTGENVMSKPEPDDGGDFKTTD